jgi:hypothetical protein
MASTVVDKIVKVAPQDEYGKRVESVFSFAWTTIYRKYDGAWKIDCITSTDRPVQAD